ncbi:CLIP-associating protein 2-like isoform X3 [Symsagittifera roscoffensis]|uniref:CLIP-associating protein 2-like isoform X3 n=1 Tax=Symsagittifera roscoffensis TaxID=84072 RepID=UPI00307BA871
MAAVKPEIWEKANELVESACKQDNNVRLKVGPQLILFLDGKGKLDGRQSDQLIDAMNDWIQSSNFKISLMAIDVFNVLVFKLASIDRNLPAILQALLETLKTSNDQVREQVQNLLGAITDKCTPTAVADKIVVNGLTHKAWRVREETLVWIINTLEHHGKEGLQVSKFISQVCHLVVDANVDVRDRAVHLLVEVYKHVGDRLRMDLEKKNLLPDASKRKVIFQKFEEAKQNDLMKVAASPTTPHDPAAELNGEDGFSVISFPRSPSTPRNAATIAGLTRPSRNLSPGGSESLPGSIALSKSPSAESPPIPGTLVLGSPSPSSDQGRVTSKPPPSRSSALARVNGAVKSATSSKPAGGGAASRSNSVSSAKNLATRKQSAGAMPASSSNTGAVTANDFQKMFDDIKPASVYSARSLDEDLTKVKEVLENMDNDWSVRVKELKRLCAIMKANVFATYPSEVNNHLKEITRVLSMSVKDLRSQVAREACISVAFMCLLMGVAATPLAEGCLASLFSIVPNSAKIIASSGCTALMYITQHVHSNKLIPILISFQAQKSIPCRLQLSRMLEDILRNWDASVLDKYFTNVEDCLVKLLSDADEKTRVLARKGFFALKDRFPSRADILMATLDPRVQRKLSGEASYGSSVNSLAAAKSQSSLGSQESLGGRSVSSLSTRMGVKNTTNGAFKKSHSTQNLASKGAALSLSPPQPQTQTTLTHKSGLPTSGKAYSTIRLNSSSPGKDAANFTGAPITPISTTPNEKYRRKSSPRIGVSSLSCNVRSVHSSSVHNLTPEGSGRVLSIKSEGSTSTGRNRKSTASLGNELELENEGDANSSTFLDTSSSESGFAEDSGGLMSVNDERVKRTLGPGDRTARTNRMAQSQRARSESPSASRSGSRGTSPQTARLNILTSPTVVGSGHQQPLTDTTNSMYTPLSQRSSQQSRIGGPSPTSGVGASQNRRTGIPRSLNASREHSPSSGYGTRSVTGNRSSLGSSANSHHAQRSLHMTPHSASRFQKIQHERQNPQGANSMRMLSDTPEARKAIEHALLTNNSPGSHRGGGGRSPYSVSGGRVRHESFGNALSDDDSDRCSLQSYDSRFEGSFENMGEVLDKCAAQNWSDRKEGLLALQQALRSRQCQLNRAEIKKACDVFTRMFGDPHVKVLSLLLEVLADFVLTYFEALNDWLSVLLPKLLQKTGAENLLNSGLMKVNRCLEIVRSNFSLDLQFLILMKYIADQTQTKSLKVKLALLKYLLSVIDELTPHEFVNSADTRQALQLVLTWSTDKNNEIRRNAVAVVTSLFDLNTSEFNALQNALPKKELQHLANNILHQYVNNFDNNNHNSSFSGTAAGGANSSFSSSTNLGPAIQQNTLSPHLLTYSPTSAGNYSADSSYSTHSNNYVLRSPLSQQQPPNSLNLSSASSVQRRGVLGSTGGSNSNINSPSLLNRTGPAAFTQPRERKSSTSSNKSASGIVGGSSGSGFNVASAGGLSSARRPPSTAGGVGGAGDDEGLSYQFHHQQQQGVSPLTPNSQQALLHKTTADIHKYFGDSGRSAEGYDSGIPSMPNSNVDLHGDLGSNNRIYDPNHYADKSGILESPDFIAKRTFDLEDDVDEYLCDNNNTSEVVEGDGDIGKTTSVTSKIDMQQQQEDEKLVEAILQELSHHNSRIEQRKSALISLTKLIKEGNSVVWEEHFKMCLMMLFETMSDKEPSIRALVLRVLKEFLKYQQHRFQKYSEITILKTLDAHKDSHKDVVRASEELTYSVVNAIEHTRCLQVLCPVVSAGDFPINQTAVKMLTKIIEDSPPEEVETFVEQVCPALMKAYEHQESSVRKDSVYGLVAVHQKVGQAMLDQYTNQLSHGKLKLLRLYISRASSGNSNSGGAASSNAGAAASASGDKKSNPSSSNHNSVAPSLNQPQQIATGSKT